MSAQLPWQGFNDAAGVCAAIITYYPDVAELAESIDRLQSQVGAVLIVDNASLPDDFDNFIQSLRRENVWVIHNAVNEGVAGGINRAVQWAREQGYDYLLPLDQDSLPAADMVPQLLSGLHAVSEHSKVAAVGPCFIDAELERVAPFVRVGFPFNTKLQCEAEAVVDCDFLISSGSLIPITVLDEVGDMDEALFIDNVDLEWCFRARHKGYRLFGIGAARMEHRIGDRIVRSWLTGNITVHSPVRLYYIMRNRVLLYRRIETPWRWIGQDLPRLVFKFLQMALLVRPRRMNARHMLAGLWDGLRRVRGPNKNAGIAASCRE